MKIRFAVAAGVAAVAALVGVTLASSASATTTTPAPVPVKFCKGWYVNPDEGGADPKQGNRLPTPVAGGLQFQGSDLIHHATKIDVKDLKPGSYVAAPAPSLSSFFSVEVLNDNGTGYATLRWDAAQSQWNIGGTSYYDANPLTLVNAHNKGTVVRSFGVGYVNSPNNGAKTVVSSVTFAGQTYSLVCLPPKPSHTATPKPPVTSTVTTTNSPAPATVVLPPVKVPVQVTVNPGQFAVTPNTSKGVDTGDGSLS